MAEAVVVMLCQAVADVLSGASLSQEVIVSRAWRPTENLEQLETAHLTVLPRAYAAERESRRGWLERYDLFVVVRRRIDTSDLGQADAMALLVEEVGDLFRGQALTGATYAVCETIEAAQNDPGLIPEHWDQLNQFTAVWRLTYRVVR